MKKRFGATLLAAAAIAASVCIPAEARVGDVIGTVYNTDIYTRIGVSGSKNQNFETAKIPSYAANGQSIIKASDLRNYCHRVDWYPEYKSVYIYLNADSAWSPLTTRKTGIPGSKFTDILETDISVYVVDDTGSRKVTSYNVDGYTMIPVEELNSGLGSVEWVPEDRVLNYNIYDFIYNTTLHVTNNGKSAYVTGGVYPTWRVPIK